MNAHAHYFDHASMGLPSSRTLRRVGEAVVSLGKFNSTGTQETLEQFGRVERARRAIARLIHADPAGILLVGNTTQALGTIATSLPLTRGDNVLIADVEFMGAPIAWQGVCRRVGVEFVPVKTRGGVILPDEFAARANSRTRAIIVSSVQEVSGWRSDLGAIREIAARHHSFLIVDGIQEVGARPVDFGKLGVDAYIAGGHKWLRSPFGLGFACFSPGFLEVLDPVYQGYLALAEPEMGWDRYMEWGDRTPFDLLPARKDAERLQTGGYPNWLGAVALDAAADDFLRLKPARVWARILKLRKRFIRGLMELGLGFLGGPEPSDDEVGGIVTMTLRGGTQEEKKLLEQFARARIYTTIRYVTGIGGIRVAIHESNSNDDVDALLDVTRRFIRKSAKS
jgi:cysteine desulfurase / selenocysteine lyase